MFGVFFGFIKKDTCLNKCQIYFKIKKNYTSGHGL